MSKIKDYDVQWTLPHQKRPFMGGTVATSDLIEILSTDNKTVLDVYNSINYDDEAKEILKKFIDAGYMNFIMKDFLINNKDGLYRKLEEDEIVIIERKNLKKEIVKELKNKLLKDNHYIEYDFDLER